MQGVVEESSKIKALVFAPEVSRSITPMRLISLTETIEPEAGVESTGTTATKRGNLLWALQILDCETLDW